MKALSTRYATSQGLVGFAGFTVVCAHARLIALLVTPGFDLIHCALVYFQIDVVYTLLQVSPTTQGRLVVSAGEVLHGAEGFSVDGNSLYDALLEPLPI